MAMIHEFVIMDNINDRLDYVKFRDNKSNYDFSGLHDNYLLPIFNRLNSINTYNGAYPNFLEKPFKNLCYYGITLIPLESLEEFKETLRKSKELFFSEEFRLKNNLSLNPVNDKNDSDIIYIDLDKLSKEFDSLEQLILRAIKKDTFLVHYGI